MSITVGERKGEQQATEFKVTWARAIAAGVVSGLLFFSMGMVALRVNVGTIFEWRKTVDAHMSAVEEYKERNTERITRLETHGSPASNMRMSNIEQRLASQEQSMVKVAADLNSASQLLAVSTESLRSLIHRIEQLERSPVNRTN